MKRPHHKADNEPASLCCPICFELFIDPVTTPCGHSFCRGCLTDWAMRTEHSICKQPQGHPGCPVCRQPVSWQPISSLGKSVVIARLVEEHLLSGKSGPTASAASDRSASWSEAPAKRQQTNSCSSLPGHLRMGSAEAETALLESANEDEEAFQDMLQVLLNTSPHQQQQQPLQQQHIQLSQPRSLSSSMQLSAYGPVLSMPPSWSPSLLPQHPSLPCTTGINGAFTNSSSLPVPSFLADSCKRLAAIAQLQNQGIYGSYGQAPNGMLAPGYGQAPYTFQQAQQ